MIFLAFDKADEYRMLAIILGDGLLGQMMDPVVFHNQTVLTVEKSWATRGHQNMLEHNSLNSLYLEVNILEDRALERFEQYNRIKTIETKVTFYLTNDAKILLVAYGATVRIVKSAVDIARSEGVKAGLLYPLSRWLFLYERRHWNRPEQTEHST